MAPGLKELLQVQLTQGQEAGALPGGAKKARTTKMELFQWEKSWEHPLQMGICKWRIFNCYVGLPKGSSTLEE
jgi:hypothetical protein